MSHRNFCAELPKAKQVRFHGSLPATRSWTQALYFWEALTISGQGPSGRRHSRINAIPHPKGRSWYGVTQVRAPSYTPQGPKHLKAAEGGRGNISYLHPLHHTHHKAFSLERFQSCHQKLLLSDGSCSEEPIPLNSFAHEVCNAYPWVSSVQQPTRGLQMELGREHLIVASWLYFGNGIFLVNRQHHPPFAVLAFPKEKMVEACVRQLVPPRSSYLDTSGALAAAAKGTTWAHGFSVSRLLPDSGSYNARGMVDDFMPAES